MLYYMFRMEVVRRGDFEIKNMNDKNYIKNKFEIIQFNDRVVIQTFVAWLTVSAGFGFGYSR